MRLLIQARHQRGGGGGGGGAGGQCPPIFVFASPINFLPPRYFFGRKKLLFLAGKNVEICDFRQKKPSDFGEDLYLFIFFFFGDHLVLARNFTISARKSLRISVKTFFLEITCFWPEKNVEISARKSLRKSAKTFAPPILILPPPQSREAGDAPVLIASSYKSFHYADCYVTK